MVPSLQTFLLNRPEMELCIPRHYSTCPEGTPSHLECPQLDSLHASPPSLRDPGLLARALPTSPSRVACHQLGKPARLAMYLPGRRPDYAKAGPCPMGRIGAGPRSDPIRISYDGGTCRLPALHSAGQTVHFFRVNATCLRRLWRFVVPADFERVKHGGRRCRVSCCPSGAVLGRRPCRRSGQ